MFLFLFRLHWAFTCTSYPGSSWSPFLTEAERIQAKGLRGANPPFPSPRTVVTAQERTVVYPRCPKGSGRFGATPGLSVPGGADAAQERRRCCPSPRPGRHLSVPTRRLFPWTPGGGLSNPHSRITGGRAVSRCCSAAVLPDRRSPQSRSPGPHGPPPPRPSEDVTPRGRPSRARL